MKLVSEGGLSYSAIHKLRFSPGDAASAVSQSGSASGLLRLADASRHKLNNQSGSRDPDQGAGQGNNHYLTHSYFTDEIVFQAMTRNRCFDYSGCPACHSNSGISSGFG